MQVSILSLLALTAHASAHATIQAVWINGEDQGLNGGYIRSPPSNSPVKDLTSKDLTCNVNNVAASKYLSVKPGDTVSSMSPSIQPASSLVLTYAGHDGMAP